MTVAVMDIKAVQRNVYAAGLKPHHKHSFTPAFILHCAPMNASKPAHCWKPQQDSEFHVGIRKT